MPTQICDLNIWWRWWWQWRWWCWWWWQWWWHWTLAAWIWWSKGDADEGRLDGSRNQLPPQKIIVIKYNFSTSTSNDHHHQILFFNFHLNNFLNIFWSLSNFKLNMNDGGRKFPELDSLVNHWACFWLRIYIYLIQIYLIQIQDSESRSRGPEGP